MDGNSRIEFSRSLNAMFVISNGRGRYLFIGLMKYSSFSKKNIINEGENAAQI